MILANGALLPDSDLPKVLSGLEAEINHTRSASPLETEAVVDACATLLDRLDQGELDHLLSRFATPQLLDTLGRYRHTLQPESLRYKLAVELDGLWTGERPRPFGRSVVLPLGTLLHIAAGNMEGLPAFSALEGLLTGNVNLLKLPSGDTGLSLALLKLLTDTKPDLAPYLYVFSIPSADRTSLEVLAMLVAFEILQEAGLRLPQSIGQTVSIIGALVVGQSAVEAKIVSPVVVIVVAVAGITGYTMPNQDFSNALRIWRFVLTVAASVAGLFGLMTGLAALIYHLAGLESFGVAYLTPFASNPGEEQTGRALVRPPMPESKYRELTLHPGNRRRQR